jgi:murein DD-endopeptidase MepM/ murein hydrolase activator NlpD
VNSSHRTLSSRRRRSSAVALALASVLAGSMGSTIATATTSVGMVSPITAWSWPLTGPVVRAFEPPATAYGAGHRGIDIAAPIGTPVFAPDAGVVRFAGHIGGSLFLSIDHAHRLQSTYSWLESVAVARGDAVFEGERIATSGPGHPGSTVTQLHFGVKRDGGYIDPLTMLGPAPVSDLIALAPLEDRSQVSGRVQP